MTGEQVGKLGLSSVRLCETCSTSSFCAVWHGVSFRVRSDSARQAILTAALQLVQERGYAELTVEGIAARARTGKQTIYRWCRRRPRWSSTR